MRSGALRPYERSLRRQSSLALHADDGRVMLLDVERWLAPVDEVDDTVLAGCLAPTLDVGCGPGRFVSALCERGIASLGVDIAETAVSLARGRGMPVIVRDVFDRVPGEGRWPTVLLIDGNIGIGGDPGSLLARIHDLLAPDGRLIVETDRDDEADEVLTVRFAEHGTPTGPTFGWASVGRTALFRLAVEAGYREFESWSLSGRTFASLRR